MIAKILLICLYAISLGINIEKHGKTQDKPNNAWHSVIGAALVFLLLWWSGFFNPF